MWLLPLPPFVPDIPDDLLEVDSTLGVEMSLDMLPRFDEELDVDLVCPEDVGVDPSLRVDLGVDPPLGSDLFSDERLTIEYGVAKKHKL